MVISLREQGINPIGKRFSSEYFDEAIRPGNTVVIDGPSESPFRDPTLLYTSYLLRNSGLTLICDPKRHKNELVPYDPNIIWTPGFGGVALHLRALNSLKSVGIPLGNIRWLGQSSDILHTHLPPNSVDCVVDHATSAHVTHWDRNISFYDSYRFIFSEDARILKPGGRLLFQHYNLEQFLRMNIPELGDILSLVGFSWQHFKVEDMFTIPITSEVENALRNRTGKFPEEHPYSEFLYTNIIKMIDGKKYLQFIPGDYKANELYVAIKK